jgi:TolB-like protein
MRRLIGDSGEQQRLLRTIIGKGVRFVGTVREEGAGGEPIRTLPRLAIVVLPFMNLSNDLEQEYFADGITDDLTTDLSRISGSFVIARNTAFTYKGQSVDVKKIGRELGVRYVLEGSVRRAGDWVRVNVQLTDAETGAHLWANRFDTARSELAAAQDEITGRLAATLNVELVRDVGCRIDQEKAADPDARDLVMRGRALRLRPASETHRRQALQNFEQALERAAAPSPLALRPDMTGWAQARGARSAPIGKTTKRPVISRSYLSNMVRNSSLGSPKTAKRFRSTMLA